MIPSDQKYLIIYIFYWYAGLLIKASFFMKFMVLF